MDMLRIIKDKLNGGKELNIGSIIKVSAGYSIVSSDVFETFLKENIEHSADVLFVWTVLPKIKM